MFLLIKQGFYYVFSNHHNREFFYFQRAFETNFQVLITRQWKNLLHMTVLWCKLSMTTNLPLELFRTLQENNTQSFGWFIYMEVNLRSYFMTTEDSLIFHLIFTYKKKKACTFSKAHWCLFNSLQMAWVIWQCLLDWPTDTSTKLPSSRTHHIFPSLGFEEAGRIERAIMPCYGIAQQ